MAAEAERVNATNILLRNTSFMLIVLAVIELVKFSVQFEFLHLIISVLLIIFSIVAGREAVKFAQWFYIGIFENILSTALELSKLVSIKQEKVRKNRAKSI
jgi:cell division protein FtsW (lipid II flippase)